MPGKPYPISEIKRVLAAEGTIQQEYFIATIITDSRRISNAANGLFFRIKRKEKRPRIYTGSIHSRRKEFCCNHYAGNSVPGSKFSYC